MSVALTKLMMRMGCGMPGTCSRSPSSMLPGDDSPPPEGPGGDARSELSALESCLLADSLLLVLPAPGCSASRWLPLSADDEV